MPQILRSLIRAVVAAVVLLGLDGCLYRDPGVTLSDGYEIVAICASCPCLLNYSSNNDKRTYGPWTASMLDTQEPGGHKTRVYMLVCDNLSTEADVLEFKSEPEFRAACREKKARMQRSSWLLEDVKRFDADSSFILGEYGGGYFLLDIAENWVETWTDRATWSSQVRARTSLDPDRLKNPKSFWLKTRETGAWIAYSVVLLMFTPWIISPLRRRGANA